MIYEHEGGFAIHIQSLPAEYINVTLSSPNNTFLPVTTTYYYISNRTSISLDIKDNTTAGSYYIHFNYSWENNTTTYYDQIDYSIFIRKSFNVEYSIPEYINNDNADITIECELFTTFSFFNITWNSEDGVRFLEKKTKYSDVDTNLLITNTLIVVPDEYNQPNIWIRIDCQTSDNHTITRIIGPYHMNYRESSNNSNNNSNNPLMQAISISILILIFIVYIFWRVKR